MKEVTAKQAHEANHKTVWYRGKEYRLVPAITLGRLNGQYRLYPVKGGNRRMISADTKVVIVETSLVTG